MVPTALFFLFKIPSAIQDLLWFHINFKIICFSSVKNSIDILIEVILNLQIASGSMNILIMLILLIYLHSIAFHLFVSVSFVNVL